MPLISEVMALVRAELSYSGPETRHFVCSLTFSALPLCVRWHETKHKRKYANHVTYSSSKAMFPLPHILQMHRF